MTVLYSLCIRESFLWNFLCIPYVRVMKNCCLYDARKNYGEVGSDVDLYRKRQILCASTRKPCEVYERHHSMLIWYFEIAFYSLLQTVEVCSNGKSLVT